MTHDVERPLRDRAAFEAALPRLAVALREASIVPEAAFPVIERQFDAGQSNPTYLLRAGDRLIVLRKQPFGALLPRAHDVIREYSIMKALHARGFAVPRPLYASADRAIIGTDFFLMDYVAGAVHSDAALPSATHGERAAIYRSTASTLGRLHSLDPVILAEAGITGRGDFVSRQIDTWHKAYKATQTTDDGRIDAMADWLRGNRPADAPTAIVHGDYRIENLIVAEGAVAAVLDWELCTIGDPRADVAHCCIWHHLPSSAFHGVADKDLPRLGIPSEQQFLEIYQAASGIEVVRTHRYFMSFAFYRLAAILQGVFRRALDGTAASTLARERGSLADLCLAKAELFAKS